ncbi:uncharacterized protein TNCV_235201 [Trichonephila clavipes]|uniref:Uncharacterized protein n=1 Tax=Trichonephila clavipes TaxID=2585209 RepID=A0A8X6SP78_TRICX|nr:uncharacterized protein TNCV_235201 [Trichonephila clavipes]
MDMVDAWSPAEDSDLKVWDLLSLCLSVSKSGCIPFYLTSFSHENSRADYLPRPLNCLLLVKNQRRVTARGSLHFGNRGKSVDAQRSSPVPLKTRRVGQRCTLNLSRAETSSRWCGVVVRRGVPALVSSTSLDHGSKLRGPSPKALV